ncbi:hypothetical protein GCM10008097_17950 [Mycetocola manganoxydans]|nr:hypothetical protein GCM10008097_17950 [Mycetocola manganoxydans]
MPDIMLDRERLRTANEGLKAAITEFENAAKNNDDLENSIDRPDDRGSLRDKASDFESSWNDKREALLENLTKIQEHLQGIIDGWETMDTEAAASLSSATPTTVHSQVR